MLGVFIKALLFPLSVVLGFVFTFAFFFVPGCIIYGLTNSIPYAISGQGLFIFAWISIGFARDQVIMEKERLRRLEEERKFYESNQ